MKTIISYCSPVRWRALLSVVCLSHYHNVLYAAIFWINMLHVFYVTSDICLRINMFFCLDSYFCEGTCDANRYLCCQLWSLRKPAIILKYRSSRQPKLNHSTVISSVKPAPYNQFTSSHPSMLTRSMHSKDPEWLPLCIIWAVITCWAGCDR